MLPTRPKISDRIRFDYELYQGDSLGLYHNIGATLRIGIVSLYRANRIRYGMIFYGTYRADSLLTYHGRLPQCSDTALVFMDEQRRMLYGADSDP